MRRTADMTSFPSSSCDCLSLTSQEVGALQHLEYSALSRVELEKKIQRVEQRIIFIRVCFIME